MSVVEAMRWQRAGFDIPAMASPLYAAVLDAMIDDHEAGGRTAQVFAHIPAGLELIDDAIVLRVMGALHRVVLRGEAPGLARWYPTAGGSFSPGDDVRADVVAAVDQHFDALVAGLDEGVQTNEVGRCAALAVGFCELLRRYRKPLRLLEIGSSAGLNLRWDRWRYESGGTASGPEDAPLRFAGDVYERPPHPDVSTPGGPAVVERRGCDRSPIDPTTEAGRLLLRSFVWPDQAERYARLDAAIAVAREVPATVDRADAGEWLEARLAEPAGDATTVVYHSIVWQYLPPESQARARAAIESSGVAWLRLEPFDSPTKAEVRLRVEGEERSVARSGFHGRPVWAAT
jgi:hypothetical protein